MQSPSPGYNNRLIHETSPYLLQHAHNPVDWYPWDEEAFSRAKAEDKPVLVSIGYSACHWCHVMEHESFEDEATAQLMNENFVNIKVDMEERPDVDQIYMQFVQITTGRGGWPMTVFVTPDKVPFFGGTYFPPEPRYGMASFRQILLGVADAWRERRDEIMHSATDILGELRRASIGGTSVAITPEISDGAFASFERAFDGTNGGFGGAPKFPPAMSMEFLLRFHRRTGNARALEMVRKTADKMAGGGIYDQIGGGFHRYSVDAVWLVPHFEKMLYDNAQLVRIYLHLWQITRDENYRRVAVEILEYVRREMLDASGGFYSTQDADSEGEEGKFFVWTPAEIEGLLGEKDAQVFNFYFDVSEEGNFEGNSILNRNFNVDAAARALKMETGEIESILDRGRKRLFEEREKRVKPHRDEKVLTAWNGLMLAAFAEAAAVFDNSEYMEVARKNADFILSELSDHGRLLRTWKDGKAKLNAYVEDYANVADGLLELFQVSAEIRYFTEAVRLANLMITEFWDAEEGGLYFTSKDHEELIVRNKDYFDNATPSGNSVAADVFLKLTKLTGDDKYERFALAILRQAASQIRRYPQGFGRALSAIEFHLADVKEIAIIAEPHSDLEKTVWQHYLPNKVVARASAGAVDVTGLPLLSDRSAVDGLPTAYVCEHFVCQRPVTEAVDLRSQLGVDRPKQNTPPS
jgi:uncharacterized protein YyaL (SSP411 family)